MRTRAAELARDEFFRLRDQGIDRQFAMRALMVNKGTALIWERQWAASRGTAPQKVRRGPLDLTGRLEDYAWLRASGVDPEQAAQRVGVEISAAMKNYEPRWRTV